MKFIIKHFNIVLKLNFTIFQIKKLNKTALYIAVENENIEIIKALLKNNKIDLNLPAIIIYFFIKLNYIFNYILN